MQFSIRSVLSLIFVIPIVAFSQVKVTSKDIKIISASAFEFSSGAAREGSQGNRGIQYEIVAVVRAKNGIVCDSLVTERGTFAVETAVGTRRSLSNELIRRSDTVQVIGRVRNEKPGSPPSGTIRSAISKVAKSKNQFAFLLYTSNGKRCLVQIGDFKKSTREPNQ